MEIECVIFDLDGTLVDSEGLCNQAFLDLVPELDCSLQHMVSRYRGQKLASILSDIETHISRRLPGGFEQSYRARVAELFETDLKPIPGVSDMLGSLDFPICVASSGPRDKIMRALSVSSLSHFFGDGIFSSYDVGSWKPDPDLFLHAAKVMNCPAHRCAVIEDSLPGIQAAVAAKMRPFLYSPEKNELPHQGAVIFNSMKNLPGLLSREKADRGESPSDAD